MLSIGKSLVKSKSSVLGGLVAGVLAGGAIGSTVFASEDKLYPSKHPWVHEGLGTTLDHAALRRGFEVYRQVCSTCHSLEYIAFRHLIGVTHTEEQAKMIAATYQITDGPNSDGEMFQRPGVLSDYLPKVYPNDEFARVANNGALPPDLACMHKGRADGSNYLFSLLTGYMDAPHGVQVLPGLYYNPYFQGGAIAMPPPLSDGMIEYEDGTPATVSQMAKDVTEFLQWTSHPDLDNRKRTFWKMITLSALMIITCGYMKRQKWSTVKTNRMTFVNAPHKSPLNLY